MIYYSTMILYLFRISFLLVAWLTSCGVSDATGFLAPLPVGGKYSLETMKLTSLLAGLIVS